MKRKKEEVNSMEHEEHKKILIDSQVYKDKIDKYKIDIYEMRKKLQEMEKYQSLYEDLKIKDNER
jgi:hypothetical protein